MPKTLDHMIEDQCQVADLALCRWQGYCQGAVGHFGSSLGEGFQRPHDENSEPVCDDADHKEQPPYDHQRHVPEPKYLPVRRVCRNLSEDGPADPGHTLQASHHIGLDEALVADDGPLFCLEAVEDLLV